jgi:hypothetical protein
MAVPGHWMAAFDELSKSIQQLKNTKKIVLFFDELPWMCTPKSSLLNALEYFWNRYWSNDTRIKLIVCGSSASWIVKKIIKNRGGLHNRTTRKIRLQPFTLNETLLYLNHLNHKIELSKIVKLYMVLGGIPFYLKHLKHNLSVDQNINQLLFNPDSVLFNEFHEIFSSLFDTGEPYMEIIKLIANTQDGLSRSILDTKNKLTGKGGRLTQRLEELESGGFISSYLPFGYKKKGIIYRLSDEYCYFYLKWIAPIKDKLKQSDRLSYWINKTHSPDYYAWLGYSFENLCYKHLPMIRKTLQLGADSLALPWRSISTSKKTEQALGQQGAQIDLLFDRQDDAITICEIKYTDKEYSINKAYADILRRKLEAFKQQTRTKKQLFLILISPYGVKKNNYSGELLSGEIVLEDLLT